MLAYFIHYLFDFYLSPSILVEHVAPVSLSHLPLQLSDKYLIMLNDFLVFLEGKDD
jgi:hypothetical protein